MQTIKYCVVLLFVSIFIAACGESKKIDNEIIMGVSPGPYNELFDAAIAPILEKEGYSIKRIDFRALLDSNVAMLQDEIDVVVAQHEGFMKVFNAQRQSDLVAIQKIPTVPAAIFSKKFKSLEDVEEGMIVLIPMDESNAARAYGLLQKIGWIELDNDVNFMKATKHNIKANPYNLVIQEIDSALIPRVLDEKDFAVIPGSIVWLGKMDPALALAQEDVLPELFLQVVVRDKNKDSDWAKAIVRAYNSNEFKTYMDKNNVNNYWVISAD